MTDFNVQGWTGSAWTTLATVSGNNLVKRTVTFSAFTTARIRVNVTSALMHIRAWSRSKPGAGCSWPAAVNHDLGEFVQSVHRR